MYMNYKYIISAPGDEIDYITNKSSSKSRAT